MSDTAEIKPQIIRVGSRKSELALWQTKSVIARLKKIFPSRDFELHTMTTMGDRILNISLPKIGEKSLFTKDLEDALYSKRIDFVVHSLKDLPTCLPDGLAIGAILEREDPRDALILNKKFEGKTLDTLPEGSIIGTSSLRRTSQLNRRYPHLIVQDIRGNLNTRLAKLDAHNTKFSGIILAQAGIMRMGWHDRISQSLEPTEILYAVGQGALAVECRANDPEILSMLSKLSCMQTQCRVLAERSFLRTLGGGCSAPVAVETILSPNNNNATDRSKIETISNEFELVIKGAVWSLDGKVEIVGSNQCNLQLKKAIKRLPSDDVEDVDIIDKKRIHLSPSVVAHDGDDSATKGKLPLGRPTVDTDVAAVSDEPVKELSELIHIHEDAFKKCPYATVLTRALSIRRSVDQAQSPPTTPSTEIAGNEEATHSGADKQTPIKCPLHFPIGEDVMGQCPYFDTSDERNLDLLTECIETNENKSKIETNISADNGERKVSVCPFSQQSVVGQAKGCPYSGAPSESKAPKCPYLGASSSSSLTSETVPAAAETIKTNNVELFCGLFGHDISTLDILRTCEAIGQKLAAQLISNGAQIVMEAAQNEIRKGL